MTDMTDQKPGERAKWRKKENCKRGFLVLCTSSDITSRYGRRREEARRGEEIGENQLGGHPLSEVRIRRTKYLGD